MDVDQALQNFMTVAICENVKLELKVFVCFVALRPKSTAMVMAGPSVHLTTLFFLGKLEQAVNQYLVHTLSLVSDNNPSYMIQRKGGE